LQKDSRVAEETALIRGLPFLKKPVSLKGNRLFLFINLKKANSPKGLDAKLLA
jgi:hypothetical protein